MDLNGLVFRYLYLTVVLADFVVSSVVLMPLKKARGSLDSVKNLNFSGESICALIFFCFLVRFIFPKRLA